MAGGLEKRTPRSLRERQAYRAVQAGSLSAAGFVLTTVLALVGVIGDGLPIVLLLATVLCVLRFAQVTGVRNRRS